MFASPCLLFCIFLSRSFCSGMWTLSHHPFQLVCGLNQTVLSYKHGNVLKLVEAVKNEVIKQINSRNFFTRSV